MRKGRHQSTIMVLLAFLLIAMTFSGCGGSGGASEKNSYSGGLPAENTGAFRISIAWPDGSRHPQGAKIIPGGSDLIDIEIDGEGLDDPILTEIPEGEDDILIENIPVGFYIVLVRAKNGSDITAQRKESIEIMAGMTSTSSSVPLGIALTEDTQGNIFFEPTSITLPYDSKLYFQNWTSDTATLSGEITGQEIGLGGSSETSGLWDFSDEATIVQEFETFGVINKLTGCDINLAGASLVTGEATCSNVPVKGVKVDIDGISSITGTYGKYMVFPLFSTGGTPVTAGRAGYIRYDGTVNLSPGSRSLLNIPLTEKTGTEIVSLAYNQAQGLSDSYGTSSSDDGRYVAFRSNSTNLTATGSNGQTNIYLRDRDLNETTIVSIAPDYTGSNGASTNPSVSGDGDLIAFESAATNLVSGDSNAKSDIFVYNRHSGLSSIASQSVDSVLGDQNSSRPAISNNGLYIAFESESTNLISGQTLSGHQIYARNINTGMNALVSANSDGTAGNGTSTYPAISGDGRYIVFRSDSSNLVSGDTNGVADIFMHDLLTGTTSLVSYGINGAAANGAAGKPAISIDGSFIAFESAATNIYANDANSSTDIFVRNISTGTVYLASCSASGEFGNGNSNNPSISRDGRLVAFDSDAANIGAGDGNGSKDVFLKDLATGEVLVGSSNDSGVYGTGVSGAPMISGDGRVLSYESTAADLTVNDSNGKSDIFVHYIDQAAQVWPVIPTQTPETPALIGTVEGTVMSNGSPIVGATITVGTQTGVTDDKGFYVITGFTAAQSEAVTIDQTTMSYTLNGYYQDYSSNVLIIPGSTVTHNIELFTKPCTVTGYVYNSSGSGVSGATVTIDDSTIFTTTSGSGGSFTISNIPVNSASEQHEIKAALSGHEDFSGRIELIPAKTIYYFINLNSIPATPTVLEGTVTCGGANVEGAIIDVDGRSGKSDSNGHYSISGFQTAGDLPVLVTCPKYEGYNGTATIALNTTNTYDIILTKSTGSVSGIVTTNGQPAPGVIVAIDGHEGFTDSNGSYIITGLTTEGDRSVTASGTGYQDYSGGEVSVTLGETTVFDFSITPLSGTISGVVSGNGKILPDATVTVDGNNVEVGDDGRFTVPNLDPGSYIVIASNPGYQTDVDMVEILPGQTTEINFVLQIIPGTVQGTVTCGGTAVAGATITLDGKTATTNKNGVYMISNLTNTGSRTITAKASGYITKTGSVEVALDTTTTYDITLEKGFGIVQGTVKNASGQLLSGATVTVDGVSYTTTSNGQYFLLNLPDAGARLITATCSGYNGYKSYVTVVTDTSTNNRVTFDITMNMSDTIVTGKVINIGQSPISGVTLTLSGQSSTTGADGIYKLKVNGTSGMAKIMLTHPSYGSSESSIGVAAGQTNVYNFMLVSGGGGGGGGSIMPKPDSGGEWTLHVNLIGYNCATPTDAMVGVAVLHADNSKYGYWGPAGASGSVDVLMPSSVCQIICTVKAKGYYQMDYTTTTTLLSSQNNIAIKMAKNMITGVVVDKVTQEPVSGAQVNLVETAESVTTGEDGYFEMSNVDLPGKYLDSSSVHLWVSKQSYNKNTFNKTITLGTNNNLGNLEIESDIIGVWDILLFDGKVPNSFWDYTSLRFKADGTCGFGRYNSSYEWYGVWKKIGSNSVQFRVYDWDDIIIDNSNNSHYEDWNMWTGTVKGKMMTGIAEWHEILIEYGDDGSIEYFDDRSGTYSYVAKKRQ